MTYSPKVIKHGKLPMSSPVQQHDARGGTVSNVKTQKLGAKHGGKGATSHFPMEGPTSGLAGGGWVTGAKTKKG
jgi:hypothetical protein